MFIMMTILSLRRQHFACCIALFLFHVSVSPIPASAGQQPIIVQSTTSTLNSGLYDYLLPFYQQATGKQVRVVAVGTGQALKNAERCDGDVLIVHSREDEINFIEQGFGSRRYNLMYNDFVLLGPYHDPAGIEDADNISAALRLIAQAGIRFVSRGDNSGTHKAEKRFWEIEDNVPTAKAGSWYIESGQGMGSTLNLAVQMQGYVLSDRATWLAFANKQNHAILFSGDPDMFNQYGIIPISPDHCPNTYNEDGLLFTKWMISEAGQQLISAYERGGEQLFFPNADQF